MHIQGKGKEFKVVQEEVAALIKNRVLVGHEVAQGLNVRSHFLIFQF